MSRRRGLGLILLALFIALVIAGCGKSNQTFSTSEADNALATADSIQAAVEDGRCTQANTGVQKLIAQAQRINNDRPDLGAAYAKTVERLQQLIASDCQQATKPAPTKEVTAPTETPTPPTSKTIEPTPKTPDAQPTGGGATPPQAAPQPGDQGDQGDRSGGVSPG